MLDSRGLFNCAAQFVSPRLNGAIVSRHYSQPAMRSPEEARPRAFRILPCGKKATTIRLRKKHLSELKSYVRRIAAGSSVLAEFLAIELAGWNIDTTAAGIPRV
jgi:hypothetical protein